MLSLWKVIYRAIDLYLPLLKNLTSGHNWFFPFFYYVVYNTILVSRTSLWQGNHIYEATQLVIMLLRRHKNVFEFFYRSKCGADSVSYILDASMWGHIGSRGVCQVCPAYGFQYVRICIAKKKQIYLYNRWLKSQIIIGNYICTRFQYIQIAHPTT